MFYAYELFVKKGPLGKMWLAGTMKKITRSVATTTNIVQLCNVLEHPPAPLALPTQATLLRGVVRIEHQKVSFLLTDAVHAKSRVMLADKRLKKVNLPLKHVVAKKDAITLLPTELAAEEEPMPDLPNVDVLSQILASGDALHILPEAPASPRKVLPAKEQDIDITRSRVSTGLSVSDEFELPPMEPPPIPEPQVEPKRPPRKRKPRAAGEAVEPDLGAEPVDIDEADKKAEEKHKREKRKKRATVPVDVVTEISDEQMKANIRNADDIVDPNKWRHWKPPPKPEEKNRICASFPLWHLMPEQLRTFYREHAKPGPIDPDEGLEDEEEDRDTIPFPSLDEISLATDRVSMEREARPSAEPSFFEPQAIEEEPPVEPPDTEERKRKVGPRKSETFLSPFPSTPTPSHPLPTHAPPKEPTETEISKMTEIYREVLQSQFDPHPEKTTLDFGESLAKATVQRLGVGKSPSRYDASVSFHQLLILRQLDVVKVAQSAPYAALTISRGRHWKERFSSSQMGRSESQDAHGGSPVPPPLLPVPPAEPMQT